MKEQILALVLQGILANNRTDCGNVEENVALASKYANAVIETLQRYEQETLPVAPAAA